MPINTANAKLRKRLEDMTTESWLSADDINDMFRTDAAKQALSDLKDTLSAAKSTNESAAATWLRLSSLKETVLRLVKRSVGV